MLDYISATNFKCFANLRLALEPLTVLTGYNASGKSSSIQPLLLLAQHFRTAGDSVTLALNGPLVRLGTAGEVLARGPSQSRLMEIGFSRGQDTVLWNLRATQLSTNHSLDMLTVSHSGQRRPFPNAAEEMLHDAALEDAETNIRSAIRSTVFIGAGRIGTAEILPMPEGSVVHGDVGTSGQYAAWWFAEHADDEIDFDRRHPNEDGITLRRQLDAYLSDLFPHGQANAELISRTPLTRLGFRTNEQSDYVRPANTGYGFTHAFPILVALLLAERGQILIIDSPEAHLHPSAQSRMGRILSTFASSGVQIIVETHSDHLLNGIRLSVKENAIESAQVLVHFFSEYPTETRGDRPIALRISRNGSLSGWPSGFFDQNELDLIALSTVID